MDRAAFEAGVRELQTRVGVRPDGDFGPVTLAATLEVVPELPKAQEPPERWTYGGAAIRKGVDRDPANLEPVFADRLELLFRRMRHLGWDPILWEGLRSRERAAALAARGTGIPDSMHCYGLAADGVDSDDSPWTAPAKFWKDWRGNALDLGLHVLFNRDGSDRDLPHVQAVSVADQRLVRAFTNPAARAEFVTVRLGFPPVS